MNMQIQTTADGSPTIYLPELDEHYHSVKGALAESLHVFIREGLLTRLAERLDSSDHSPLRVLEVGFGTGLNTALTAALPSSIPIEYYSIELFPLPSNLTESLQFSALDAAFNTDTDTAPEPALLNRMIHAANAAPWNEAVKLHNGFTLTKMHADFLTIDLPTEIDVVYFDAFAPEKQPAMWAEQNFRRLYDAMRPDGILTTYCAKGAIRRLLASVGFRPERRPGPPSGKREILRARR